MVPVKRTVDSLFVPHDQHYCHRSVDSVSSGSVTYETHHRVLSRNSRSLKGSSDPLLLKVFIYKCILATRSTHKMYHRQRKKSSELQSATTFLQVFQQISQACFYVTDLYHTETEAQHFACWVDTARLFRGTIDRMNKETAVWHNHLFRFCFISQGIDMRSE